jgi:DsbC/DsbD-like thiol-disulfide interchange protein
MNRRLLILAAAFAPFATSARAADPWRSKFLWGAFDGKRYLAGLNLELDPGWKTYWRVPGAGGIPPDIQASGENLKSFTTHLPVPKRLDVNGDEIIGFEKEVTFLFEVEPVDPAKQINLNIVSFMGVCETVCIPVPLQAALKLTPIQSAAPDLAALAVAQQKIPRVVTDQITAAKRDGNQLVLTLAKPVDDIFVECKPTTYVKKPTFIGLEARMDLVGKTPATDLTNADLRITMAVAGQGLEQTIRVS